MEKTSISRRIDELGRVVLPMQLRKKANWAPGDALSVFYDEENRTITLKLYEKQSEPKCAICGKNESKISINDRAVCAVCCESIKRM